MAFYEACSNLGVSVGEAICAIVSSHHNDLFPGIPLCALQRNKQTRRKDAALRQDSDVLSLVSWLYKAVTQPIANPLMGSSLASQAWSKKTEACVDNLRRQWQMCRFSAQGLDMFELCRMWHSTLQGKHERTRRQILIQHFSVPQSMPSWRAPTKHTWLLFRHTCSLHTLTPIPSLRLGAGCLGRLWRRMCGQVQPATARVGTV